MEEASLARNEDRVKFRARWKGPAETLLEDPKLRERFDEVVEEMGEACKEMEKYGVAPALPDGRVGGNASVVMEKSNGERVLLVTKSRKYAHQELSPETDVIFVTKFDADKWEAEYY